MPSLALPIVAGVAVVLVAGAALGARVLALDGALVARTGVLAAVGGVLVVVLAARQSPAVRFGAANTVTLLRGALTLLLLALLAEAPSAALGWTLVGLATVAAVLDAVDGKLARARGEANAFGARFDMETDALLILVLAALVWQHGKAGAWILLAGLLRYFFVAAGYVWRWLAAALPPSRRRQTVCVVQIVSLIAALAPVIAPPWSALLAFAGLAALGWSFWLDVTWLARRPRA